jgi:hypothetical protein
MTSTIVKSLAVSRNGGNERPLFDLQRLKPATARAPGWGGHWHGGGWGGGGPGYWGAGLIGLGVGAAAAPLQLGRTGLRPGRPPGTPYCAQRYRSFNSHTGYFTGYDGQPYFCQ